MLLAPFDIEKITQNPNGSIPKEGLYNENRRLLVLGGGEEKKWLRKEAGMKTEKRKMERGSTNNNGS